MKIKNKIEIELVCVCVRSESEKNYAETRLIWLKKEKNISLKHV